MWKRTSKMRLPYAVGTTALRSGRDQRIRSRILPREHYEWSRQVGQTRNEAVGEIECKFVAHLNQLPSIRAESSNIVRHASLGLSNRDTASSL